MCNYILFYSNQACVAVPRWWSSLIQSSIATHPTSMAECIVSKNIAERCIPYEHSSRTEQFCCTVCKYSFASV